MDKYYVILESAIRLKEIGFNVGCDRGKLVNKPLISRSMYPVDYNANKIEYISLPLYAQAFDWFDEVYGLKNWIVPSFLQDKVLHSFKINSIDFTEVGYTTKEEANQKCLEELLEMVESYGKSSL